MSYDNIRRRLPTASRFQALTITSFLHCPTTEPSQEGPWNSQEGSRRCQEEVNGSSQLFAPLLSVDLARGSWLRKEECGSVGSISETSTSPTSTYLRLPRSPIVPFFICITMLLYTFTAIIVPTILIRSIVMSGPSMGEQTLSQPGSGHTLDQLMQRLLRRCRASYSACQS